MVSVVAPVGNPGLKFEIDHNQRVSLFSLFTLKVWEASGYVNKWFVVVHFEGVGVPFLVKDF